jgi:transaldolase
MATSAKNPLLELSALGQAVWIDFLSRSAITSGQMQRLVEDDGVRGVTSNPSIFEKAIVGSPDYEDSIRPLARAGRKAAEIIDALTIEDIRACADVFRPLHDRLEGADGFVSLEVSPELAHDTAGTVAEANRLWRAVDKPNVMIKVPATKAGIPAIRELLTAGINVNITLLFGLGRYEEVAEAFLTAMEARAARHQSVRVASVASFFLSRIDVMVDAELEQRVREGQLDEGAAARLRGQIAIASARQAHVIYRRLFEGPRGAELAAKGARPQRLLWASTGTKNKADSDVKYVEAVIGAGTIDTMPLETLEAYRDHGQPAPRLEEGAEEARERLEALGRAGVSLDRVTQRLEDEGVKKFVEAYQRVLAAVEKRRTALAG